MIMTGSAMISHLKAYKKQLPGDLLFENSITAMMLVDKRRVITVVNKQFCTLFGYTPGEVIGLQTAVLTPTKRHFDEYRKYFEETRDGSIKSSELQYKKKTGELFWVKLTGSVIPSESERYILWSFDDITREVESRKEIHNRYLELDIIFNRVPTGLVYVVDDIIERVNPSFLGMLEARKAEVVGRDIHEFIEEIEVETDTSEKRLVKFRRGDETLAVEYDTEHVAENSAIILFHNVTRHVIEKQELFDQARTDNLTGLLNRSGFQEEGQAMFDNPANESLTFAMLDIDYFKKVNDTYGHVVGDEVLVELAELLKRELRKREVVGRLGGEEFAVVFAEPKDHAIIICKRLLDSIRAQSFTKKRLNITVSIGLVHYLHPIQLNEMYKEADRLLYEAKSLGRNRLVFCTA